MDQVQETRDDNASDDGGDVTNPPAYVEMVVESRLPTVSALWKLSAISASLTGSGSGNFKQFARDLMALVYKYVVGRTTQMQKLTLLKISHKGTISKQSGYLLLKLVICHEFIYCKLKKEMFIIVRAFTIQYYTIIVSLALPVTRQPGRLPYRSPTIQEGHCDGARSPGFDSPRRGAHVLIY